ncbi:3927_t:CDS:2 [Acaulospora morrowiae]|uniref:3927_t:CDS:1 n=1 Tax=Acaulospora morrowiae TaxID=94023 RepID=A0A9N9G129_9GLOM|nr:3927_t:CDS:2 [Acaulospora morrowiae]
MDDSISFEFQSKNDFEELRQIIFSFLAVTLLFLFSLISSFIFLPFSKNAKTKSTSFERFVFIWLLWEALIHIIIEGPFVYMSVMGSVEKSNGIMADMWKEYGKADSRWLTSDPTIVSVEIPTSIFLGPLSIYVLYLLVTNHPSRHYWQLVLCICDIYGCWITFCPEWLTGNQKLHTESFMYFWVYLVFFNGLWVLIPSILAYQSWTYIVQNAKLVQEFEKQNLKVD